MFKKLLTVIVVLGLLGGCVADRPFDGADFGNSVKQNIALQTIKPDAEEADLSESIDGAKAEQALTRYREMNAEVDNESLVSGVGQD